MVPRTGAATGAVGDEARRPDDRTSGSRGHLVARTGVAVLGLVAVGGLLLVVGVSVLRLRRRLDATRAADAPVRVPPVNGSESRRRAASLFRSPELRVTVGLKRRG